MKWSMVLNSKNILVILTNMQTTLTRWKLSKSCKVLQICIHDSDAGIYMGHDQPKGLFTKESLKEWNPSQNAGRLRDGYAHQVQK